MRFLAVIAGAGLLGLVLLDAFQSIILPRRPVGRFRITRLFFISTWQPWKWIAAAIRSRPAREQFYSIYGPLSLLVLIIWWALLLTTGFGFVFFGLRLAFHDPLLAGGGRWAHLRSCLYYSGTTIFTLGLGDVLPQSHVARLLTVLEAGTGLGFVALVIGYVPVLYTAFSQREILVALLDARAGSPPTATELLLRHDFSDGPQTLRALLAEWERWCAQMLETHISYPILCYYRSQHDNQSWLAALTAILDACALIIATLDGQETRQAQLTFAVGRHTLVDLVHVFHQETLERQLREAPPSRLPDSDLLRLQEILSGTGYAPCAQIQGCSNHERLLALRTLYEPSACALAEHLRIDLPRWVTPVATVMRPNDVWTVMEQQRLSGTMERKFTSHVSAQSTAVHLESHDEIQPE